MKKYYFLFTIIFFISCDFDKNPIASDSNKYVGKWIWIKTVGGILPIVTEPEEGILIYIQYDIKNVFKIFRNDTLKVKAKYVIERMEDYNGDRILYTNIVTYEYRFNREYEYPYLHGDTLEIWDGIDDGYTCFYIKE